jgi:hypothetical protein
MISFRLSEEEFQLLQEASMRTGARSVSEYTRDAVCSLLLHARENGNGDGIAGRIDQLALDLRSLDAEVQHLRHIVVMPVRAAK